MATRKRAERAGASRGRSRSGAGRAVAIRVLFNNIPHDGGLETAWGSAFLVETARDKVLFDAGGVGFILLGNMKGSGVDPADIHAVALSHEHADHTGGFWELLKRNRDLVVYVPASFSGSFKSKARGMGAHVVSVAAAMKICEGVRTTGELGDWIKEQSLIVEGAKGTAVLTGCAHPGIDAVVEKTARMLGRPPAWVLGGFHLKSSGEGEIRALIDRLRTLGVRRIGPNHCTGARAIEMFREAWGRGFVEAGCGACVRI